LISDTTLYNYIISYDISADFYVFELQSYGNSSATSETLSTTEMWIEPKLGYKYTVDENLNLHSWVGVKAFDAITSDVRDDLDKYHNNKFKLVVGFNYSIYYM
jgi:hypothetical protein